MGMLNALFDFKTNIYFMKTVLIIIANLIISVYGLAQTLKTYKGGVGDYANAYETYTYYEKDSERIKHGNYQVVGENYPEKLKINGNFKHGLRNGQWTFDYDQGTGKIIGKANFLNDTLHGNCQLTMIMPYREKNAIYSGSFTLKKGQFYGKYRTTVKYKEFTDPEIDFNAEFDQEGFITDDYYEKGFDREKFYSLDFDKDLNIDYDSINNELFLVESDNVYFSYTYGEVQESLDNKYYSLRFMPALVLLKFLSDDVKGWKTRRFIKPTEYNINYRIKEFEEKGELEKAKKLKFIYNYYEAEKNFKLDEYVVAQEYYSTALKFQNDENVMQKLQYCKTIIRAKNKFEKKLLDEAEKEYLQAKDIIPSISTTDEILLKIKKLNEEYNSYCNDVSISFFNQKYEEAAINLYKASLIKVLEPEHNSLLQKIESEYLNLRDEAIKLNNSFDYDNSIKKIESALIYNSKDSLLKSLMKIMKSVQNKISMNKEKIETTDLQLKENLKKIYKKVYPTLYNYFNDKMAEEKNPNKQLVWQDQIFQLQKKINNLLQKEDKFIEKNLKTDETIENFVKILELSPSFESVIISENIPSEFSKEKELSSLTGFVNWNIGKIIYGIKDVDNNLYPAVSIGSQIWMAENLKTTKYNDGTAIPLVTDDWINLSTPGYCWYSNDSATYAQTYGALYNWYTVNTGNLCPTGWHVPSDAEWTQLTDYLGGASVAGGKLKETGTTHWLSSYTRSTNETGFTALPGGFRDYGGTFSKVGTNGSWWSSTEYDATYAWSRTLSYEDSRVYRSYSYYGKTTGFSVRCLRD